VSREPGEKKKLLDLDEPVNSLSGDEVVPSAPRPTVVPKFNPSAYAEASEIRERMPTLTDEAALEDARLQSFPTNAPPPRRQQSTMPGPLSNPRDSSVEIDVGEDDLEALGPEMQIEILRTNLAPLGRVPVLARKLTEIGAALADPKTAYVIGFVDGILPLETIVDVTGLSELDTLRVLDRLVGLGILVFRPVVLRG